MENIPDLVWKLLLMLSPVLLIQLGLGIYSLVDLRRRKKVRGNNKILWAVGLIVTMLALPSGIILSAVYLAWGRQVEDEDDSD